MRTSFVLALTIALAGCGANGANEPAGGNAGHPGGGSGGHAGVGAGGTSGSGTGAGTGSGGQASGGGTGVDASLGVVIIDVQEAFVSTSATPDMPGVIERTKSTFQLAADHGLPFFVTFEDSQTGDHALHAPLVPVLPSQAQKFTKTTFDATGQPAFAEAVQQANVTHLIVLGAETDVCVMQTVLGLRKLGFGVLLDQDAVFTEETNTSPAKRRMQQAGAPLVSQSEVAAWVADPSTVPAKGEAGVTLTTPLNIGVVLNAFSDASIGATSDALNTQKSARLRELLLVSEWFDLPVYSADPLPSSFASYYKGSIKPLGQIASDQQLVFAGTDANLAQVLTSHASHVRFVMEDALLAQAGGPAQKQMLEPFFAEGLVPTTYKSFYYDMTHSVSLTEWPSQAWVQKFDEFYWITQAPEDLPPIPGE